LSSAILYLAIVAIWACVLVPRWLRRSHVAPSDPEVLSDQNQTDLAEYGPSDEFARNEPGAALGEEAATAYADPLAWEDPAAPGVPESPVAGSYSVTASYSSYSAEVTYSAETVSSGAPADTADADVPVETSDPGTPGGTGDPGTPGGTRGSGAPGGTGGSGAPVAHGAPAAHGNPAADRSHPQVPMRPPGPAPHVLQARRRTLTMLIAITVAVMGAALIGLVPWWTSVPPFVLLGVYLLLLREAAHADAERARSWAEAQARAAHAARAAQAAQLARERAREAQVAPPPEPTAEIINISALAADARDQPYDQYADAEIRAVGD
jgi:hypothetical protein